MKIGTKIEIRMQVDRMGIRVAIIMAVIMGHIMEAAAVEIMAITLRIIQVMAADLVLEEIREGREVDPMGIPIVPCSKIQRLGIAGIA
jgi:hypothetical protein